MTSNGYPHAPLKPSQAHLYSKICPDWNLALARQKSPTARGVACIISEQASFGSLAFHLDRQKCQRIGIVDNKKILHALEDLKAAGMIGLDYDDGEPIIRPINCTVVFPKRDRNADL